VDTLTAFLFRSLRLLNSSEVDVFVIIDNPFPAINEHKQKQKTKMLSLIIHDTRFM